MTLWEISFKGSSDVSSNRNLQGGSISTFKQSLSDDGIFKWCYQQPPDPLISITLPFIKVKLELRRMVLLTQQKKNEKRHNIEF